MTAADFQAVLTGASALVVAFAALFGVQQYGLAAAAEERLKRMAAMEIEISAAEQLSKLMSTLDAQNERVGLATQRSAIESIVRLGSLYSSMKPAALSGLVTLRNASNYELNHPYLDAAIRRLGGI